MPDIPQYIKEKRSPRPVTQIGATAALALLRTMAAGKFDFPALEAAAKTSKKKARQWRQAQFLLSWVKQEGIDHVLRHLKENEGQTIYLLEDGTIALMRKEMVPRRLITR